MIKTRIHKTKTGYYYYCRQCKTDHSFEFGNKINVSPCRMRHHGIEKDSKVDDVNDLIVLGCVWKLNNYRYLSECGFSIPMFSISMPGDIKQNGFIFCPKCSQRIYDFNRGKNDKNI